MSFEKVLSDEVIKGLRTRGVIQECEIAIKVGDIVVAENVLTKSRRILSTEQIVLEENRSILKG